MDANEKGQSAIEFFILVGVVIFFLVVFLFLIQSNIADSIRGRRVIAVKEIAVSVQDEIALASASSEGYTRHFTLPQNVDGIDYEVKLVLGLAYVRTLDEKYALALPVLNVTGQPLRGDNVIKKVNGAVYLNS